MRRAEARERRHEIHAAVVGDAGRERLDVGRGPHEAEAVADPLDDRAADEYAALERVLRAIADLPRDGRHELLRGSGGPRADVLPQEAAGAAGVLRHAPL